MQETERVTLRIPEEDLRALDFFVQTGEFSTRSDAIRRAIKDFIRNRAKEVKESWEARRSLVDTALEVEKLRAQLEAQQEILDKLVRK